jgi:hypothetical protein
MKPAEWTYNEEERCWSISNGPAYVTLAHRPQHCDRGRWVSMVSGIDDIDGADGFPRYFMNLDRAKAEMAEWLGWRLRVGNYDAAHRRQLARIDAAEDLGNAAIHARYQQVITDGEFATLLKLYHGIRERLALQAGGQ